MRVLSEKDIAKKAKRRAKRKAEKGLATQTDGDTQMTDANPGYEGVGWAYLCRSPSLFVSG